MLMHTDGSEKEGELKKWWIKHKHTIINICWFIGLLGAMILLGFIILHFFKDELISGLKWIERQGFWGNLILGTLLVIAGIPPLPFYGILLLSCAFLYRWWALITMMIGANLGAWLGFALLRSGDCIYVERQITRSPILGKIVKAIEHNPWKLVFLTRLSPLPYSILNGLFGFAKDVPFFTYATASFLGMWLEHISAVIYGVTLREFADVLDSNQPTPPSRIIIYVLQAVVITIIVIIVSYYVNKSLHIDADDVEANNPSAPNLLASSEPVPRVSSSIPPLERVSFESDEADLDAVLDANREKSSTSLMTETTLASPSTALIIKPQAQPQSQNGGYEEIR